jgi:hypothetical protein
MYLEIDNIEYIDLLQENQLLFEMNEGQIDEDN